jgi:hypothetical protein
MYLPAGNFVLRVRANADNISGVDPLHRAHGCRTITSWAVPAT